ncbi:hypothetical protein BGZ65_005441 [Modicella reniformis]|uniref:Uncharacterized protein n=1 Tax=Modicella reniformis TaxID=1440133 RepID=A0A9P6IXX8_9FUNG|nr:hypothetical protein BGZ65_005441 [Modicella reniformis]
MDGLSSTSKMSILIHHGYKLTSLTLFESGRRSLKVARTIPTRNYLPNLKSFELIFDDSGRPLGQDIEVELTSWITNMISAPSAEATAPSTVQWPLEESSPQKVRHPARKSSRAWRPLKKIVLKGMGLSVESDWTKIIKAIDFTALEELTLNSCSLSNVASLADGVEGHHGSSLPLRILDLYRTSENLSHFVNAANHEPKFRMHAMTLDKPERPLTIKGLEWIVGTLAGKLRGAQYSSDEECK